MSSRNDMTSCVLTGLRFHGIISFSFVISSIAHSSFRVIDVLFIHFNKPQNSSVKYSHSTYLARAISFCRKHLAFRLHLFVRLRSFHHDNQTLTMKATMIRLNIANPMTSVRGNAASDSFIAGSLIGHEAFLPPARRMSSTSWSRRRMTLASRLRRSNDHQQRGRPKCTVGGGTFRKTA